ncbi:organic hydroperoxide resistance protein [uncultured Jatrophihabitans sp.]|uniref:organic hydroperoxide resistance protein n=1 Tax=uncultured Jatrophihabitans sp. TaxID=1610747 RepID=UPI0035CABC06
MTIALTKIAYTTAATAKGGRAGHVASEDGVLDLDTAQPGSSGEPKANPETLFAAGYAACFQGALGNRAKTKGVDTSDSTVTAEVSFGPSEDGGFGIAVELKVSIPGVDPEQARELVELAHEFCPYSKATKGNIDVTLTVE